jgi:DNA helicase-2/ATP-dependent DNA helicase PcrA
MADVEQFVNGTKTKIIAPAGYGKTHFIADCIKYAHEHHLGKQLVLTHTHAGVASIRAKLLKHNIPPSAYNIETICGYAQKYVFAFATYPITEQKTDIFYKFIIEKATEIFSKKSVLEVIKKTYTGIFIDEYQDCTLNQHNMLMQLKDVVPLHLLGDPMQGIFAFNDPLVDFDRDLIDFSDAAGSLQTPWRWQLDGNNARLGSSLKLIRDHLDKRHNINISEYTDVNIENTSGTIYSDNSYKARVSTLLRRYDNILIISNLKTMAQRQKLRMAFGGYLNIGLIEAIDDKDFYEIAEGLDNLVIGREQFGRFIEIIKKIYKSSFITEWFNPSGLKKKFNAADKVKSDSISVYVNALLNNSADYDVLYNLIYRLKHTLGFVGWRYNLVNSIITALQNASIQSISALAAMYNHKNHIRRIGRKICGRNIGTTLLTKGLEFDSVIILDAQDFSKKDFYVAITRACKTLTIFTQSNNLIFS